MSNKQGCGSIFIHTDPDQAFPKSFYQYLEAQEPHFAKSIKIVFDIYCTGTYLRTNLNRTKIGVFHEENKQKLKKDIRDDDFIYMFSKLFCNFNT